MKIAYTSPIGLEVSKGDWEDAQWTITGFPKLSEKLPRFESAYDFEEVIREKINNTGITFDSEYCQFFAYAKTKARAIGFAKAIEKYFKKVEETVASSVTW